MEENNNGDVIQTQDVTREIRHTMKDLCQIIRDSHKKESLNFETIEIITQGIKNLSEAHYKLTEW